VDQSSVDFIRQMQEELQ